MLELAAYGFLGIGFIGYAIAGVLFIVWFFQSYPRVGSARYNCANVGFWVDHWWMVHPLANFVIPKLVMNEVDRMSNPEAGDPPIEDKWRSLPRLESSDMWWALFVSRLPDHGNRIELAANRRCERRGLCDRSGHACLWIGSDRRFRHGGRQDGPNVGERLHEPQQATYRTPIVAESSRRARLIYRRRTLDPRLRLGRVPRTDGALPQLRQGRVVPDRAETPQHTQDRGVGPRFRHLTSAGCILRRSAAGAMAIDVVERIAGGFTRCA